MRPLFAPLALCAAVLAPPALARPLAVLIGVSDYLTLDADLQGPSNDVALMAEVLISRGVAAADITALVSDGTRLPAGLAPATPPTRAAILAALDDVAHSARPGDTVVFYFSGHGGQAPDQSGDEGGGYDEIFLPADAAGWKGSIGAVENAILDDELQVWAAGVLAKGVQLVGLIDACHSDTGFRGVGGAGRPRGLSADDLGIPNDAASASGAPAPALTGPFVFLYSSQSDQRSFEYPVGDTGLWHGEFTLRLAETLRTAPQMPWSQVLAVTAAAMTQGAAPQMPAGEGPLLQASLFGTAAPPRFAVQNGTLQAGLLQGLTEGTELALYDSPAGGTALGHVVLTAPTARTTPLPKGSPATATWAEVSAPAAPPPLRLAAPVRADPGDGLDYADWLAALGPGQPEADLVPILTGGGLALAGADGRLDPDGPGSTPRVSLSPGETHATALDRVLAAAAYSHRLQALLAAAAGRSLMGKPSLDLTWQRKPALSATASACGDHGPAQPVDPAAGLAACDQLWLGFSNVSGRDLDVSILYFNADFSITPVWPRQGLSNRLAPGETARAGLQIDPGSVGAEQVLILSVPVEPGAARVDLTRLAEPDQALRGGDAAEWFAARLSDPGEASSLRGFSLKPAALNMLRQVVRVAAQH